MTTRVREDTAMILLPAPRRIRFLAPYALALAGIGLIVVIRTALDQFLGTYYPYVLFLLPAIAVANWSGWRPGAFGLFVGILAANYYFVERGHFFWVTETHHQVGMILVLFVGGGGIYLAESRRRGYEALHRQQDRLLDHAYDPILTWDLGGTITYWNVGAERLYGFSTEEAIGRVSHDLLHTKFPDGREAVEEALRRTGHWDGELQHCTRTGAWITVDSRMVVVSSPRRLLQVLEANRDVTARKREEEGPCPPRGHCRVVGRCHHQQITRWNRSHLESRGGTSLRICFRRGDRPTDHTPHPSGSSRRGNRHSSPTPSR